MRLDENYVRSGYFWIPGKEERKIPGTLTINNGGEIELEIVGLFDDEISSLNSDSILGRINGCVENDGFVTLNNCFYSTRNISFGGIAKSNVFVNSVFSGVAYAENEVETFNTLSFSVDCLDEWVGISGIRVNPDWENRTATITYNPPEKIEYVLANGMRLEILFAYTLPGFPNTTEAKITQRTYFQLKSDVLLPLSDFTEIAYKIVNLMCFAIDDTVSLKNLTATSTELIRDLGDGKTIPAQIKIYYPSIPFCGKAPRKNRHQMLFNFRTITSNAQNVFNNWINSYESLSPALGLYFSTKFGDHKLLEGKFLALAQGLETYHRRTSDEKLMRQEVYDSLVDSIIEKCPEGHVAWLEGRLMHGNEINLGKRIKRIIEPFKDHFGSSQARSKLLRKIVDTRNYLTHYSETLKSSAAEGRELWVLCLKMEVIFQLHFLKVIGFTDCEINDVVKNCYPIKNKLAEI